MKLFRSSKSKSTTTAASSSVSSSSFSINNVKNNNDDNSTTLLPTKEKLHTHIEVCARIRPLQIITTSQNSGYFSNPSTTRRKFGIRQQKQNLSSPSGASKSSPGSSAAAGFVAWDVNDDGDTAGQSKKTELIQGRTHSYTLDKVYDTQSSTKEVYDNSMHSLVSAAMEGYHSSILAYGQTSTGKTFTMTGTKDSPGLIPLCIRDCFRYVKECQESREYLIRVSYLEIYKENIRDLLSPTIVPIRLFDGPNGLIIKGLKEEVVTSPEKVFAILKEGEARRQVGATHMNQHSSRSHVMVRLWIESSPGNKKGRNNKEKGGSSSQSRVSSLSLVDLAGSESVRLNGTDRREEGHYINKSLMTLGQVVLSLSENKTGHIPYRDSKLTRLLQPSLSGNAQMVLLCCIHPHPSHLEESHNTFKFAARAKKIKQKAVINTTPDEKTLLQNYRDEIEDLKHQLAEAKQKQEQYLEEKEKAASAAVAASTSSLSSVVPNNSDGDSSAAAEIKELVQAIKTMERLILKSHPHALSLPLTPTTTKSSSSMSIDIDDDEIDLLLDDDDDEKDDLDLLLENDNDPLNTTPKTTEGGGDLIQSELSRIRGLLDTVLTKRSVGGGSSVAPQSPMTPQSTTMSPSLNGIRTERLDFSTPPSCAAIQGLGGEQNNNKEEVLSLRKQLEQQELASNLRKADSSFLQTQLKEKDELLVEVSRVLEAVEARQAELETENAELRLELDLLKARFVVI